MKFRQHLPEYFDHDIKRFDIEVKNTLELLEIEKIKDWSKMPGFFRFSKSEYWDSKKFDEMSDFHRELWKDYIYGGWHLMAEFKNGFEWFVLGTANEELDLPKWHAKKKE